MIPYGFLCDHSYLTICSLIKPSLFDSGWDSAIPKLSLVMLLVIPALHRKVTIRPLPILIFFIFSHLLLEKGIILKDHVTFPNIPLRSHGHVTLSTLLIGLWIGNLLPSLRLIVIDPSLICFVVNMSQQTRSDGGHNTNRITKARQSSMLSGHGHFFYLQTPYMGTFELIVHFVISTNYIYCTYSYYICIWYGHKSSEHCHLSTHCNYTYHEFCLLFH